MLTLLFVALLVVASGAKAAPVLAELRVEGPDGTLDPGTWYVTGKETVRRGRKPSCRNARGTRTFKGSTALGILGSADDVNDSIRPTRVRRTSFGPQMCGLDGVRSFGTYPGASAGWLYNVNYVSGFSSADLATIEDGDQVLWVYGVFPPADPPPTGDEVNTGKALELTQAPAGDQDGSFQVRVQEHDFDGTPADVDDAAIEGATTATAVGSGGLYNVTVPAGFSVLRATRGLDVPSNPVRVCSDPDPADCPSAHGRKIVGSSRNESLEGTGGWDEIKSRGGDDTVDVTAGGRDQVSCGRGDDEVLVAPADSDNQIGASCEEVTPVT